MSLLNHPITTPTRDEMIRDYMDSALQYAVYDKLADNSFSGEIPKCPGTIAFGQTLEACRQELKAALQDWLISALRHGDDLPVINGLDLNGHEKNMP